MIESPPPGRLKSFQLADVPLEIRRRHGAALLQAAADDANLPVALELKRAIENPSPTVYRVPDQAWQKIMG